MKSSMADIKKPKWTVLYNIDGKWIGTGWEFFDDYIIAKSRYAVLNSSEGYCATLRHFHEKTDRPHMGAVHQR